MTLLPEPISFEVDQEEVVFTTTDDIEAFITGEAEAWKWADPDQPNAEPILVRVGRKLREPRNAARGFVDEVTNKKAGNAGNELSITKLRDGFLKALLDISEGRNFYSNSRIGKDVLRLAGINHRAALLAMARRMKNVTTVGSSHPLLPDAWALAAVDAMNFEFGQGVMIDASGRTLTSVVQGWEKEIKDQLQPKIKQAQTDLGAHREQMETIRANYEEQMSLLAPRIYWSQKQQKHDDIAIRTFVVFSVFLLIIILGLYDARQGIQGFLADRKGEMLYAGIIAITIPAFSLFWVLRHISRVFITHFALSMDAGMRATMVETYLALSKKEDIKPTDDSRKLILEALFRPMATGSEDGPHLPLLELLKDISKKLK